MRFEVDCAKSHHHVISEGLIRTLQGIKLAWCKWAFRVGFETNAIASPSNNVTSRSLQPFACSGLTFSCICGNWSDSERQIVSHAGGIIINHLLFFFFYYLNTPVAATLWSLHTKFKIHIKQSTTCRQTEPTQKLESTATALPWGHADSVIDFRYHLHYNNCEDHTLKILVNITKNIIK